MRGIVLLFLTVGCRVPSIDPDDPRYERFEGVGAENACGSDADCVVGGCSGEICAAEDVGSTCEMIGDPPEGSCGCVQSECQWYTVGSR